MLRRKLCIVYLSTDLLVSKSDTPQIHQSLTRENWSLIRKERFYFQNHEIIFPKMKENWSLERKERSYHQNHEILFPKIKGKLEYKTRTPHRGKGMQSYLSNFLLLILYPFLDLSIGEVARTSPPNFFFAGLHRAADALGIRRSR